METIRVAGAQINLRVGDLDYNEGRILEAMGWAEARDVDVLLFPELAVPGYPPEDLVMRRGFLDANLEVLRRLASASGDAVSVVGFVDRAPDGGRNAAGAGSRRAANAAALLQGGRVRGVYRKVLLPNYGVFDEERYFAPGADPGAVWIIGGAAAGVSICEDIWSPDGPPYRQAAAGAQILLNINGSPYQAGKQAVRSRHIRRAAADSGAPVVYLNLVGGQDELVFDGGSTVLDGRGNLLYRAASFEEEIFVIDIEPGGRNGPAAAASGLPEGSAASPATVRARPLARPSERLAPVPHPPPEGLEATYRALVLGLRDYVSKNGFSKVVVGLSGGIDSALTAVIAADALGPEAVRGITMPSGFSSEGSVRDSEELARRLGIRFDLIPVSGLFAEFRGALRGLFEGTGFGVAEENLQPRIRGTLLMAVSNKFGEMVIATGNKSEAAVGYATLYGDMAGGYAVLKDVLKTKVYELAEWRNSRSPVIPGEIIRKPPSAELRPGQLDTDSLPPYGLLDRILTAYIEEDRSVDEIADSGLDREMVIKVAAMVDRNEYKRRQAPPGVKITGKAFGRDRRLPITNRWRRG